MTAPRSVLIGVLMLTMMATCVAAWAHAALALFFFGLATVANFFWLVFAPGAVREAREIVRDVVSHSHPPYGEGAEVDAHLSNLHNSALERARTWLERSEHA